MNIFEQTKSHLRNQVWCVWACDWDVDTDDDDVRNTGPYPHHEGPGHWEGEHGVHTEREEEEKRYLTTQHKDRELDLNST